MIVHFTLTDSDTRQIPHHASENNRLGFALQLVLLRFLGFHLTDLQSLPKTVVDYIASQIEVDTDVINSYGECEQTRTDHQRQIEKYLGFRHPSEADFFRIEEWLLERVLNATVQLGCYNF